MDRPAESFHQDHNFAIPAGSYIYFLLPGGLGEHLPGPEILLNWLNNNLNQVVL